MSHHPISLACVLLPLLAAGCGCGEKRCDPKTFTPHCDGEVMEFCLSGEKYGVDWGTYVQRTHCAQYETCHDFGDQRIGCIHEPLTKCDPATYEGTCVGPQSRLVCANPSSFVFENYVIAVPAPDCPKN